MAAVFTAIVRVKTFMLFLEAQSKPPTAYLISSYKELSPEAINGVMNLSFFWWLNGLFKASFRQLITTADLFEMDPSSKANSLSKGMNDDSICGLASLQFDEAWYRTVLEACTLDEDIRQRPEGDKTIIGSKGLDLAEGQKQRLFTRDKTLPSSTTFYSALGIDTQVQIASRLFSKAGLFRRLGTTIVLSTHTVRCSHLAGEIIVLDAEGKVSMESSYLSVKQTSLLGTFAAIEGDEISNSQSSSAKDTKIRRDTEVPKDEYLFELIDVAKRTGDLTVYAYYFRTIHPALWLALPRYPYSRCLF
ncbi:hypothetical protein BBP40_003008 [Aspergillus hancockii]|nr:hypothetical protein BBP40_003008 [Aspergillus hancockii]